MRWTLACGLVLTACLLVLYQHQIASNGADLTGDFLDGRLADMLQLHWLRVLQGREAWNRLDIFYPTPDTLGFNDGYLLFGLLLALFHALGANVFLAAELGGVVFRIVGFVGIYALGREALGLGRPWALLAAAIGLMSNGLHVQQGHEQMLAAYLAPGVGAMVLHAFRCAREGRRVAAAWTGSLAALVFALWLLTAFYMLWFAVLFAGLACLVAVLVRPVGFLRGLRAALGWWMLPPVLIVAAGLVPFVMVYAPARALAGTHPWPETFSYTLAPFDLIHTLPGNLLTGWFDRDLSVWLHHGVPGASEHAVGLPPLLWLFTGAGIVLAARRGAASSHLPMAAAFCVSVLLAAHVGYHTAWLVVYEHVPGAQAVRVVCRFLLLLGLVAGLLAAVVLQRLQAWKVPRPVLAALALLLVAEEVNTGAATSLHPAEERDFLARVGSPPAFCRSFVVSRGRQMGGGIMTSLLLNVDAMTVAEMRSIPTPFGDDTFIPPGLDLLMFDDAAWQRYPALLREAELVAGDGACDLDLARGQWSLAHPAIATLSPGMRIGFDHAGRSDAFIDEGWSAADGLMRWTVGPQAGIDFRWSGAVPPVLHVVAAIGFETRHPSGVDVVAGSVVLAHWRNDPAVTDHVLHVPASAIGADGIVHLRFLVRGAVSPAEAGFSIDTRRLGMEVSAISAD